MVKGEIWKNQQGKVIAKWASHYEIGYVNSIEFIKKVFSGGKADELNWFFCSTSGIHGRYATLNDLEQAWDLPEEHEDYWGHNITVLIVQPRLVTVYYGDIEIKKEDIPYLRKLVQSTLIGIVQSQEGNF